MTNLRKFVVDMENICTEAFGDTSGLSFSYRYMADVEKVSAHIPVLGSEIGTPDDVVAGYRRRLKSLNSPHSSDAPTATMRRRVA